jgi:hypothetical protein
LSKRVNCPHCHQALPDGSATSACPICGRELPPAVPLDAKPVEAAPTNWPVFFAVLLAPPAGCFFSLAMNLGILAAFLGCVGSLVSGVICARIIMEHLTVSGPKRGLVGLLIGVLFCGFSYFLSALGCSTASSVTHHGI